MPPKRKANSEDTFEIDGVENTISSRKSLRIQQKRLEKERLEWEKKVKRESPEQERLERERAAALEERLERERAAALEESSEESVQEIEGKNSEESVQEIEGKKTEVKRKYLCRNSTIEVLLQPSTRMKIHRLVYSSAQRRSDKNYTPEDELRVSTQQEEKKRNAVFESVSEVDLYGPFPAPIYEEISEASVKSKSDEDPECDAKNEPYNVSECNTKNKLGNVSECNTKIELGNVSECNAREEPDNVCECNARDGPDNVSQCNVRDEPDNVSEVEADEVSESDSKGESDLLTIQSKVEIRSEKHTMYDASDSNSGSAVSNKATVSANVPESNETFNPERPPLRLRILRPRVRFTDMEMSDMEIEAEKEVEELDTTRAKEIIEEIDNRTVNDVIKDMIMDTSGKVLPDKPFEVITKNCLDTLSKVILDGVTYMKSCHRVKFRSVDFRKAFLDYCKNKYKLNINNYALAKKLNG